MVDLVFLYAYVCVRECRSHNGWFGACLIVRLFKVAFGLIYTYRVSSGDQRMRRVKDQDVKDQGTRGPEDQRG